MKNDLIRLVLGVSLLCIGVITFYIAKIDKKIDAKERKEIGQ